MVPAARVAWVDSLRGVGILLVVMGHVAARNSAVHNAIFTFHMPLFFFLSGWLLRTRPLAQELRARWHGLVIPYVSYMVLVAVIDAATAMLRPGWRSIVVGDPWAAAGAMLWSGQRLTGVYGVFWFVPCLFVAALAATLIEGRGGGIRRHVVWLVPALVAAGYLAQAKRSDWPLDLGITPVALLFVIAGHLERSAAPRRPRLEWLAVVAALGLVLPGTLDLKYGGFGIPLWSFAVAWAWCLLLCRGGHALALRSPRVADALAVPGRASAAIMFLHLTVVEQLRGLMAPTMVIALAVVLPLIFDAVIRQVPMLTWLFMGRYEPAVPWRWRRAPAAGISL